MKKVIAILLTLALIVAFVGCKSSNQQQGSDTKTTETTTSDQGGKQTEKEPEPVTLKWVGAGWLASEKADTLISRWVAQNPHVKVEYTELGSLVNDEYLKNLDVMIASGEQIDLTYLGVTDLLVRALNGAALPINDAIAQNGHDFEKDYTGLAKSMLTVDGNIYGVPYANNTFKVFYNKTMTDAKGITIPEKWSIDEFTDIAKKLNDPDNKVWGCIFPSTWSALCYAPAEVAGWTMAKKDASGKFVPNFDDEIFKTSMKWVYDLGMTHKVSPSIATIKAESLNRRVALANKQTAMIVDGPFTLVFLQTYMFNDPGTGPLDFELGIADLPYITKEAGDNASFLSLVGAFWFPKTCANINEAYKLARFICNGNFDKGTYMPAYTGADMKAATDVLLNFTDSKGQLHKDIYPYDIVLKAVTVPNESHISYWKMDPTIFAKYVPALYTLFNEQYTTYLTGEVTLEKFVENMQKLGAAEIANVN